MRLITDADVAQLVTMREAIHVMGAAFEQFGNGVGSIAPRVRATSLHNGGGVTISALGAALPASGVVGAKVYATVGGRFNFVIVLFSRSHACAPLRQARWR
jgi:ornithine cyclodeaminase